MKKLFLFFWILLLASGQAKAEDLTEELFAASDIASLTEAMPDRAKEAYEGFDDLLTADLQQGVTQILTASISDAGSGLSAALKAAGRMLAVCLLTAVVKAFGGEESSGAVQVAGVLAVTLICTMDLNTLVGLGRTTLQEVSAFSAVLMPLLSAATTAVGAPATAAALYAGTIFFAQVLERVLLELFLPMTYACLACACGEYTVGEPFLHRLRKFLQSVLTNGLKGILICFSAYLAITGVVTGSADSASVKAAKLALSSVVPMVGSVIADASETVLVSAGLLRNAVGITGLLGVLAVCLSPFIRLGLHYLVLKLAAALGGVLDPNMADMIDAAAGTMGMILAMVGAAALFNLIACVCFMRAVMPG